MTTTYASVEDYLDAQPPRARAALEDVRRTVHEVVPDGEDAIGYQIPTLRSAGRTVVHYAGWKKHVSLYPVPAGDAALQADLAPYLAGRGTVRFPLAEPVPLDLVARIVRALVEERHPG